MCRLHRLFLVCALALLPILSESAGAHPPKGGGGTRSVDVCSDGDRVHLLTAETATADSIHLLYRSSSDGGAIWSHPSRIDEGMTPPFSPHRGMDPQIAGAGKRIVAAWTTAGTDRWGSGPIVTAWSDDGGITWQPGPAPADDGLTTGHGFLDLSADASGRFHLVWLDSRDGHQGLRYASSSDGGKSWNPNQTLQSETCECCRNALAGGSGPLPAVLYRNRDPRDMRVIYRLPDDASWSQPMAAGQFDWKFDGCPHVGGGLAVTGDPGERRFHALVWTGEASRSGVHYVRLREAAGAEADPLRFGSPFATHPDLAAHGQHLLAVWNESREASLPLRQASSPNGGLNWSDAAPVPDAAPSATHPIVVATDAGFLIVWTETPEGQASRWRSHRIDVP
ncbi:MAG TPA: sialidase family protein [Bacteroidia bacterium]|nr:sialidase family protein [Bacteroidia bacterium]